MICGLQPVREAIRAQGERLERVLVESEPRDGPQLEALARFARDHGAPVERLARAELDRMARGVRHQGTIAFAPELSISRLDDLALGPETLIVALDEVVDPQNFGAVVRSSVAMDATAVLWPEHRSAPLSPAAFRASAGAVEYATLCRVTSLPPAASPSWASTWRAMRSSTGSISFDRSRSWSGPRAKGCERRYGARAIP
jgi:23S rRNA (guanosine2251-2'-O)-methyltransferase